MLILYVSHDSALLRIHLYHFITSLFVPDDNQIVVYNDRETSFTLVGVDLGV